MSIYLDYNASSPIDERVLDTMIAIYREYYGNADSRTHNHGTDARKQVEVARAQVGSLLGVESREVIFTSGATESNNMAVLGLEEYGRQHKKFHIITTSIEHKAILESVKHLGKKGFDIELINPDESGRIDAAYLLTRVRPDTLLVSVQHVNNETGIIQPVKEIGDELWDTDTFFHIDAVQSNGKLVDEIRSLHYNMLSLSAHKMYGPQGIGALILRYKDNKRTPIHPIIFGGGHEGGLRPGTLPVALIVGLGKACEIAQEEYKQNLVRYEQNKQDILKTIENANVNFKLNGNPLFCISNTLNVSFLGVDSEALMIRARRYCSLSNGSACNSQSYSPSHVLMAMGLSQDRIESAIRLSWGTASLNLPLLDQLLSIVRAEQ